MKIRMKSDERRAAIVASAVHLFAEKGFRGTTTRELAAALGVTEPVLYQHFQHKQDLYAAIIEAKAGEGGKGFADLARWAEGSDDHAFFRHLADMILSFYEHDPEFIRLLLFSALERHELAEMFFERRVSGIDEPVVGYIERRKAEGAFRGVNAQVAARAFIGTVVEHGMRTAVFQCQVTPIDRDELLDQLVELFLNGMAQRAGGHE